MPPEASLSLPDLAYQLCQFYGAICKGTGSIELAENLTQRLLDAHCTGQLEIASLDHELVG